MGMGVGVCVRARMRVRVCLLPSQQVSQGAQRATGVMGFRKEVNGVHDGWHMGVTLLGQSKSRSLGDLSEG